MSNKTIIKTGKLKPPTNNNVSDDEVVKTDAKEGTTSNVSQNNIVTQPNQPTELMAAMQMLMEHSDATNKANMKILMEHSDARMKQIADQNAVMINKLDILIKGKGIQVEEAQDERVGETDPLVVEPIEQSKITVEKRNENLEGKNVN